MPGDNDEGENQGTKGTAFGKKVFFLNPQAVIEEVAAALAEAEFEVYTTRDHGKLARYLRREPHCLTFVNIDEGDDESAWRAYIASIRKDESGVAFGVVTMLDDEDRRSIYLFDLGVECGYIVIKIGAAKTTEILLRTLEANEARGRRRYVRAACPPDAAEFNCQSEAGLLRGSISDISSVGMAAVFEGGSIPRAGTRFKDLQLSLRGARLSLSGVVVGGHDSPSAGPTAVIMFEPASVTDEKKAKLRAFVRKTLQAAMDKALELA